MAIKTIAVQAQGSLECVANVKGSVLESTVDAFGLVEQYVCLCDLSCLTFG